MKSRASNTVALNIDWDFFFKEDVRWDWGHREARLFLEEMWHIRFQSFWAQGKDLQSLYRPRALYASFWHDLQVLGFDVSHAICVYAESNLGAWGVFSGLNGIGHIYNFDSHHDVAYGALSDMIDCGNWLGHLLKKRKSLSATVVYPTTDRMAEEFNFFPEAASAVDEWKAQGRLGATGFSSLKYKPREVSVVFICRSGCWTPPWADSKFVQLVRSYPRESVYLKEILPELVDFGDPMVKRKWNREEERKHADEYKRVITEQMHLIRVGGKDAGP